METTINGQTYRIGKLTPKQQFYIVKRLGPVLVALGATMSMIGGATKASAEKEEVSQNEVAPAVVTAGLMESVSNFAEVMSRMSDADSDYIIDLCMFVTHRKQDNSSWAPVFVQGGGFMFEDITLPIMMQLTVAVLKENLGNFTDDLLAVAQAV